MCRLCLDNRPIGGFFILFGKKLIIFGFVKIRAFDYIAYAICRNAPAVLTDIAAGGRKRKEIFSERQRMLDDAERTFACVAVQIRP